MDIYSLPNWHPAVVHFAIALAPIALLFEVTGLLLRKLDWADRAATALWVLAGVASFVALETGESAADGLHGVPPTVEPLIGTHSDWGHWTFYGLAGFALLRLGLALRGLDRQRVAVRWVLLAPELALCLLVIQTAHLGGELVYGHGVAVSKTEVKIDPPEEAPATGLDTDPSLRLRTSEDGTVVWRPASGDGAALGTLLTALEGTTLDTVDVIESPDGSGEGLFTRVSGEAWLALPEIFGDVRVEAELDLADFEGEVGLFHHAQSPESAGLLVQSTAGTQTLWELRDGRNELNASQQTLPEGDFVLAVSAAGKHLKGLVDGATVTHGHVEPGSDGRVGLMLRGEGTVRIVRLSAQPL